VPRRTQNHHKRMEDPVYAEKVRKNDQERKQKSRSTPEGKASTQAANRRSHAKHRPERLEKVAEYGNSVPGLFSSHKSRAKKRGMSTELTKEEFAALIAAVCYLCGALRGHNGIDRVDNDIRKYQVGNSKPCCRTCNMGKNKFPLKEFLGQVKKILAYKTPRTVSHAKMPRGKWTKRVWRNKTLRAAPKRLNGQRAKYKEEMYDHGGDLSTMAMQVLFF